MSALQIRSTDPLATKPRLILVANEPRISSLAMAELFGRRHHNVLRRIGEIGVDMAIASGSALFERRFRPNNLGKPIPYFLVSRTGTAYIAARWRRPEDVVRLDQLLLAFDLAASGVRLGATPSTTTTSAAHVEKSSPTVAPRGLPAFPADGLVTVRTGRIGEREQPVVDARELHTTLGVADHFRSWMSRRLKDYGFQEDSDFRAFLRESPGGRPSKEYDLTLDMAKEIAMVEKSDKGRQVRRYFIECEQRLIASLQRPATPAASLPSPAPLQPQPRTIRWIDNCRAFAATAAEIEAEHDGAMTHRALVEAFRARGLALHASHISAMRFTLAIAGTLARALDAGFGRPHIERLSRIWRTVEAVCSGGEYPGDKPQLWALYLAALRRFDDDDLDFAALHAALAREIAAYSEAIATELREALRPLR